MVEVKRHIGKAISYRMLGTLQTCFLISGSIGLTELCIKPLIYFLHERVWYKWIKFGLKENKE